MASPDDPTQVRTHYLKARDGTALVLNYRHQEANAIRAALQRIRLKGDKKPSLSLIARRSIGLYMALLDCERLGVPPCLTVTGA